MINWPAIIVHDGDDELSYFSSAAEWNGYRERSVMEYGDDDLMVDSEGGIYRLVSMENESVQPVSTGKKLSVHELVSLVQRHAVLNNTCCIEKIGFRNIDEGMAIIASLVQD